MNTKIAMNNHKNKTMKQMQWSVHKRIVHVWYNILQKLNIIYSWPVPIQKFAVTNHKKQKRNRD